MRVPASEGSCAEPPPPGLLAGIEQFNRGEYYEQHETLEVLWNAEPGSVRDLYRGILQLGVALYHLQRLNHHGVVTMLARAVDRLKPFAPACQRVDVSALVDDARSVLRAVELLGPTRLGQFDWTRAPRVRMLDEVEPGGGPERDTGPPGGTWDPPIRTG
jgi:hypothetical protein